MQEQPRMTKWIPDYISHAYERTYIDSRAQAFNKLSTPNMRAEMHKCRRHARRAALALCPVYLVCLKRKYTCVIYVYCIYTYTCFYVGAFPLWLLAERTQLKCCNVSVQFAIFRLFCCIAFYIVDKVTFIFIIYVGMVKIGQAVAVKTYTDSISVCVCFKYMRWLPSRDLWRDTDGIKK